MSGESAGQSPAAPDEAKPPEPPTGLLKRGRGLWADMTRGKSLDPGSLVLLEEACRTADRCERLDAILRGRRREWMTLVDEFDDGKEFVVRMDSALREARQQQLALRTLLAQLGVGRNATSTPAQRASLADVLAQKRAEREARGA